MITKREVPNDVLLPIIIDELSAVAGKTAVIGLRGRSMRPYLEDGRDSAELIAADRLKLLDVVLAEIRPGTYVLHRIVRIEGDHITLLGDGNLTTESCRARDVKARATAFYRKGSRVRESTDSRSFRLYSRVWHTLRPFRRLLLFILFPHWPDRIKRLFRR